MARIKLVLAYTGTAFHGWQFQPGQRTVQGCVEECLERLCSGQVRLHGAGRTDSGVHALGQVAHFDPPDSRTDIPWQKALNSLLPADICVTGRQKVGPEFHARFGAVEKTYSYTMWTEPAYILPQRRPFVWATGPLNVEAMRRAAELLVGEHDFAAFQNVGTVIQSSTRTLFSIDIRHGQDTRELVLSFTADGFLKQMVRNLAGLLFDIGRTRLAPQEAGRILRTKDRTLAPATAPPQGLCLEKVEYAAETIRACHERD